MQKLIKVSDHYYVIDNKIMVGNRIISLNPDDYGYIQTMPVFAAQLNLPAISWFKSILATTNPSLPLPQITNTSDDMVGKEVEVEIYQGINLLDEERLLCNIKPISKETSTNETLEEATKQYCWNKYKPNRRLYAIALEEYIAGYKHCEKTMYSEEELLSYIKRYKDYVVHAGIKFLTFTEWFNNNKK